MIHAQQPLVALEVLLTTTPTLSRSARLAMTTEAAGIWRRHGVSVQWLPSGTILALAPNRLRVLVVNGRPSMLQSGGRVAVGELVQPAGNHPLALISIESAQRLLASVRGRAGYELISLDERRLGIVLGRALAHEIGHYLLGTRTHARSGLMRPDFSALEFSDERDGAFALDPAAADWLRTRAETFAYREP
jgi:hypothetical protein